jgi:hypothetical protein
MTDFLKNLSPEYYLYAGIGILLLGIILGFTKKIVVYRDYSDLTIVFMLVLAPMSIYQLIGDKIENKTVITILIGIEALILLWVIISTFLDNRNIFKTFLALITKIPLGIIFTIYLIDLINPEGKTLYQRKKNTGVSALILIFLGPILHGLVRNRVWNYKNEE